MFRTRRHFLHEAAAWCGAGAWTAIAGGSLAGRVYAGSSLSLGSQGPVEQGKTAAEAHPTTGPLLDWFYVTAGYVSYKKGYAEQWDLPQGIEIAVQPAQKSDALVVPDRPWESAGVGYPCGTYKRGNKYVMHYSSYDGYQCIAESSDAFHWTKPELGAVDYKGSKRNNIIYDGPSSGGSIFEDPSAPPSERFKLVGMLGSGDQNDLVLYYPDRFDKDGNPVPLEGNEKEQLKRFELQDSLREKYKGTWGQIEGFLVGAVSPDGLHWKNLEKPLLAEWVDGDNIVHYDEASRKYVGYLRFHTAGRRSVGRSETTDFRSFPPETVVMQIDSQDPPDASIYNHAYTAYPGRDDLHLMFASMYHQCTDNIDIQLAVSHDGFHWDRPDRKTPVIPNGPPGSKDSGCIYVGPGLLELPDGRWAATCFSTRGLHNSAGPDPFASPDSTIWYGIWKRDRLAGIRARDLGRMTLRQDLYRPSAYCPDAVEAPVNNRFPPLRNPDEPPRQLKLNYKTEVGGWIRVELTPRVAPLIHPEIPPLEGYSFADCDVLSGDEMEKVVTWKGKSNVARLSDTLAVRIEMYKATLFAFSL